MVIKEEGYREGAINFIFCSDKYLHDINVKYLKHNTLTDIVTFDMSENEDFISGDIYISIERARENAREFGVLLKNEVRRLIVHGILHLAGYGDKTPKEKTVMTQKEDYYLSLPAN
jgi:rRNA maturation RNase YbeY